MGGEQPVLMYPLSNQTYRIKIYYSFTLSASFSLSSPTGEQACESQVGTPSFGNNHLFTASHRAKKIIIPTTLSNISYLSAIF